MSLGQVKSADPASQELGDLLDEHAELRDVVAQLREAGDAWILSGLLQRLHDLLQGHFAREEAAPAMREVLAAGLEPLIAEHREILESLRDRIAQVEEGEDDIPAELRREVEALLGRIHAHDARETRLLGGRIDPGSASVDASPLRSSALAVNLRRTAVDVAIPAEHAVLLEITEDQYGVHRETKKLLREINHRYVGWAQTLDELHRRATGDLARYLAHERAGEALHVFFGLYAKVVEQATPDSVRETALRRWLYVLEKVVDESGERLPELLQALQRAVSRLGAILREQPHLAVIASSRLRHLAGRLLAVLPEPTGHAVEHTLDLLAWSLRCVYEQWLSHPDPSDWYRELAGSEVEAGLPEVVTAISHARQRSGLDALDRAAEAESLAVRADALLGLPDGAQIERGFLEAAASLGGPDDASEDGSIARIHWLIRVLSLSDLAAVHRQALAEIHHAYRDALRDADRACFEQIVREIHAGLRRSSLAGSPAAYSLISKIGVDAMASEDPERIDVVVDEMLDWEFPGPQFSGFTDEWSVRVDPAHLRAIRAFLEVIGESPERARPLIAALVVRLTLGGVFMADTDLFQKDVSALLNRRIGPVYHQVRHLLALFPVYFNDIGAEGELREVSSRIDEIGARKDPLCHFLRKQCHVESNPRLLDFTDAIGGFFASGDPEPLRTYVSPSLYEALDPERPEFQAMHRALAELVGETGFGDWADRDAEALGRELSQAEMPPVVREKIQLLLRLRELVGRKYALHHDDLLERMSGFHAIDEEEVAGLREALAGGRDEEALSILLAVLERLKEIITDEKPTEGHEEIYRKRHIAVGIPSMYGRYREEKFEAVGLGLRIESLASVLFERMITVDEREYVSLGTLRRTATWLRMLLRAVRVDGCEARGVALGIGMLEQALETPGTTLDQHVNIFQIISRSIEQLIRIRFVDVYDDVLDRILARPLEDGSEPESADDSNRPETLKASEGFLRDRISKAFGVQSLDRLVTDTIRDLAHTRETFHREAQDLMMAFDLDRCTVPIGAGEEPRGGVVALGNKGHLVTRLAGAGLPVPAGFVLTTEVFRCRQAIRACAGLRRDLRGRLRDEITRLEGLTGSRFGEAERPLLLSVRSAAAISMPGVLDTFLNVGINREIARALASRSGSWGAFDAYRRFLQFWGMGHGIDRFRFDALMRSIKSELGVAKKAEIPPDAMLDVADRYRRFIEDAGVVIVDDPLEQVEHCVDFVLRSWDAEKARVYRAELQIAEEWGTAVVVQAMVFGNLGERSGTGVVLTCDAPNSPGDVRIHGDFVVQGQGDDVVSGLVETFPVSEEQRREQGLRRTRSLERDFPRIHEALLGHARTLVRDEGMFHQEIEFTFESDEPEGLYILQTRDSVMAEVSSVLAFVPGEALERSKLATGVGAGGGALSGRLARSPRDIDDLRRRFPEDPIVLVRPDTVPDDIPLILRVEGLVTALGGATSHAALVAQRLGRSCVVGCRDLEAYDDRAPVRLGGRTLEIGEFVSISGIDGSVYAGRHRSSPVRRRRLA
jgi:pyruvate,orthophosphate dikinase